MRRSIAGLFALATFVGPLVLAGFADAVPRGQLVAALDSDRETLDPHQATGTIDYMVLMHVFDHLIARNPETMKLVGGLAESWKFVDDLTWDFRIRKGVTFQNGEPLNAEAVKFSIERVLDPAQKSYLRDRFKGITQVQVTDELGIRLKTEKPNPVLLERLTNLAILPPKYVKEKGDAHVAKNPVGTGPYRFVEWARGQRLVVEAHPGYWGAEPAVKTLVFRPILDVGTAIAEMLAGGVDFIRLVPPDQIPVIEASGKAYITTAPIIRVIFLNFDVVGRAGAGPVQNVKVRQAISHAIDVDGIIQHVLGGRGLRVGTVVNPMKFGHDASIKPVPYDPGRAKQLLAEAGHASGVTLEFMTYAGSIIASRQVGDAVAGYLAKAGIKTNRQHIEDIGLSSNLERTGKLKDIYLASWGSWSVFDADMILYPRFHSSEAFAWVRDPKLDQWLDMGRNTVDPRKRMEVYSQVQRYVAEHHLVFPMYAQTSVMAVSNRINYKAASDETIALWRATWRN
ncbi:MAG: ABC transporter substrate-binding protein [Candidatus Rokuibacteriota bacterium]